MIFIDISQKNIQYLVKDSSYNIILIIRLCTCYIRNY